MADVEVSEFGLVHEDGVDGLPLFGTVQFVESFEGEESPLHLCRDGDGNVMVFSGTREVAVLDAERTRWLAGVLVAAADEWPQLG